MTCHCRSDQERLRRISSGGLGLAQACALGQAHPVVAEVGEQARAQLRGALAGLAVGVEPVPPLLGFGIGHPDLLGGAGQISLADAHGADFVVIGVRLLELAQMAALQDLGLTRQRRQAAHHLKAVARGFQHEQVLGVAVLAGPTLQLAHRHFVKGLFHHGRRRRGAMQDAPR